MSLSCPRKTSREWQSVLARANGNEDEAMRIWVEEEFDLDPTLNSIPVSEENFEDARQGKPGEEDSPTKDFTDLAQKVKLFLYKQIKILENKKIQNQKYKEDRLKHLLKAVELTDQVASISIFVGDAYQLAKQAKARFGKLLANKKNMSHKEVVTELAAIDDFVNSYSILDEIDSVDIMNYFQMPEGMDELPGPITPAKAIREAISIRDKMKKEVVNQAIPLLAQYLVEYKSVLQDKTIPEEIEQMRKEIEEIENNPRMKDKTKAKEIKKRQNRISAIDTADVTVEYLERILKVANTDEGVLDFLLNPLISSNDSALALFGKSIKSQLEFARQKDIKVRDNLIDAFQKYQKVAPASSDNTEKFNEGLFDIVDIPIYDKDGTIKEYRQEVQFVQQYRMDEFKKAEIAMKEKLGPIPEKVTEATTPLEKKRIKEYWEAYNKWYKENTQPRPKEERDAIIDQINADFKKGLMTREEYDQWFKRNQSEYKGVVTYKNELALPADKYLNKKWTAMYNANGVAKNDKGRYHKTLTDIYFAAQAKLPESQQKGFRVPSVPKSDLERLMQNGLKDLLVTNVKESAKLQSYDTEFLLGSLSEENVKFLPVYFNQQIDAKDVTYDFASSVLLFSAMANRYEAMNEVQGELSLMKTVMGAREVPEVNAKGQPIFDAFAKKLGMEEYIRQNSESYSKKHFDAFIDMQVFGEMQKAEEIFWGLSFAKISNTAMSISSYTTLTLDLLKGVANNLQANIQIAIEAAGGQFFNAKNVRIGKAFMWKNLGGVLSDFGKPAPTSLLGKMVETYDPIQGNFKDQYGKKVSMSSVNKLMRTDTLFLHLHFGEYEAQVSTMLALFDNIKVYDKQTETEMSLLQAYNSYGDVEKTHKNIKIELKDSKGETVTDENGKPVYVPFGETYRQDIMNRLHGINKYLHGVYNDFDKATVQRLSIGRLGVMYRKHLYPGYKRRVKGISMNHEIGVPTEGYYRTFANVMLSDLRQYKFNVIKNWSTYTPFQKAQISKFLAEISLIFGLATLGFIMTRILVDPDDDEREQIQDNYLYNFMLYEVMRMRSETASYINPIDAYRVVKSPSVISSLIERIIKFGDQVMPWNITEEYKRDTGIWKKGDNKAWAAFLKLMGLSGYNLEPEQAWKSFESSFFK
jgi:hypothetical protein